MTDPVTAKEIYDIINRRNDESLVVGPGNAAREIVELIQSRTTHSPSEAGESDRAFLRDLAGRIFRNASPTVGFDQGDVDRLYRIAALSLPSDKTVELLREALTDAAVTFEFYADEHQAKAQRMEPLGRITAERDERLRKSDRNRLMGVKMRKALALLLDGDSHLEAPHG